MSWEFKQISEIKTNPDNPRKISRENMERLIQSIKDFPQMLEIRPIVIDENNIALGGNMRIQAAIEAGLDKIPVIRLESLSEDKKREFIIKDNLSYGDWDWDMIHSDWNIELLEDWGMDMEGFDLSPDDFSDDFKLDDSAKSPIQQRKFIVSDEQAIIIDNAISDIQKTEEFKYVETFANENRNGNALYLIISQWAEQRK